MKKNFVSKNITILLLVLISALLITVSVAFTQKYISANKPVLYVNGIPVTETEYNFYFITGVNGFCSTYENFLSQMGLDTSKDLSEQKCLFESYSTWFDFFNSFAETAIVENRALCNDASSNGFVYDYEEEWNAFYMQIAQRAKEDNVSFSKMLQKMYGKHATTSKIKSLFEQYAIANAYSSHIKESMNVTEDEIFEKYSSNKKQYDTVTYLEYDIYAEISDSSSEEEKADAMLKAQEESKIFFDKIYDEATFESLAREHSGKDSPSIKHTNVRYNDVPGAIADWLFQCEEEKQTAYIKDEDAGCFRIVYFIRRDRDDSPTASIRQILIAPKTSSGSYLPTEEDYKKALSTAESIKEEYENGEKTEESFSMLAMQKSEDKGSSSSGGYVNLVTQGQFDKEMNDWIFDNRNPGDVEIVKTIYGYHILYFIEYTNPLWVETLQYEIKQEKADIYINELTDNYSVSYPDTDSAENT